MGSRYLIPVLAPRRDRKQGTALILNSTLRFPGEAGAHLTFAEAPCAGRLFRVIETERGRMTNVKCELCHRVLSAGQSSLSDPLNEELQNLRDNKEAAATVSATYSFVHGVESRTAEIPTKWFHMAVNAYRVFNGTTEEAALMAWPWSDVNDRLEKVTLTYSLCHNHKLQVVAEHSFVP